MSAKEQLQPIGAPLELVPEPLAPEMDKPAPYPVDALPPLMRDAVKAIIEHVQCPDALAAFSVLAAVNYLAQTRINARSPVQYSMPCSLFMLALGDSGERKSTAFDMAFKPLNSDEQKRMEVYGEQLKEHNRQLADLKGKERRNYLKENPEPLTPITILSSDASYTRVASMLIDGVPALYWSTDEGAQMLGGHSMKSDDRAATLGGLTKWWDSGTGQRIRAKANEDASGNAYGKRLGMYLLAQEAAVKDALADPLLRGQGFLPRFLFAAPESLVGTRFLTMEQLKNKPHNNPRLMMFWDRLQELAGKKRAIDPDYPSQLKPEPLPLSYEAQEQWLDAYNSIEAQLKSTGAFSELKAFASRAGENMGRVAATLAFFDDKQEVDAAAMKSAVTIVKHSLLEWLRYSNVSLISKTTSDAIKIIGWLVDKTKEGQTKWLEFTGSVLNQQGVIRNDTKRIRAALAELVEKHHLLFDEATNKFTINPLLLSDSDKSDNPDKALINQGLQLDNDLISPDKNLIRNEQLSENYQALSKPYQPESHVNTSTYQDYQDYQDKESEGAKPWTGSATI